MTIFDENKSSFFQFKDFAQTIDVYRISITDGHKLYGD